MFLAAVDKIAPLISVFINWGFMMALLFNLVSFSDERRRARSPLWICLIITLSYVSTAFVERYSHAYLYWFFADVGTALLIAFIYTSIHKIVAYYYCLCGLTFNGILHYLMYVDLHLKGNLEPWWLWSVYSFGINFMDLMMILVLIINKDFLGLCRIGRFLKASLAPKKVGDNG
ncbi:hypothetical protein [Pseudoalteromonas sp. SW0106-04]|uniref:hypothetical protein n=1 Tax=Pseudoalteromonas sp. SW0106-04 TaxID=1702169 RepID=UPI0006B46C72|nr:hypothetical protein [Pseudoalteromonas sp. SW0106-04]